MQLWLIDRQNGSQYGGAHHNRGVHLSVAQELQLILLCLV